MNKDIDFNVKAHNLIASKYNKNHNEIYNEIEQERASKIIQYALSLVGKDFKEIKALDYGCGTGNLTSKFIDNNVRITSADISYKFLDIIKKNFSFYPNLDTKLINGYDLSNFDSESYDIISVYSVLHHIPDYLFIIKEFCRVLKKGGILYIDHERCPSSWDKNLPLALQNAKKSKISPLYYFNIFNPKWYIRKYKKIKNPRWQLEGDLHVWQDDHIEWEKINNVLAENNMSTIKEQDYLLYYPEYPMEVFEKYKDIYFVTRISISKKY